MNDDELIERVEAFLATHTERPPAKDRKATALYAKSWAADLYAAGLASPAWPEEHGGLALTPRQQILYSDLMRAAKAPKHPSPNSMIVAPAILQYGTAEQKERFIGPLMRAEDMWCQGFSEPEAGSDLASLRCKAVLDGDVYRVTGQKIWTTRATLSNWMFTLVRTGAPDSGNKGISYLLIKLDSPGVSVRPLRDIGGQTHFAEVFLDDVAVPVANRLGAENEGWAVTRTSLGHERGTAFAASQLRYQRTVDELLTLSRSLGALEDDALRQDIGKIVVWVRALVANGQRTLDRALNGDPPGPESSANRLLASLFEQALNELGLKLAGEKAVLGTSDPDSFERGRWSYGYLMSRATTIGAGTAEIQRNTIAERVLGLPRMSASR